MAAEAVSVLITGANRGLGLEMVRQMVKGPGTVAKLFACCRDPDGPKAKDLQTLAVKYPNIIRIVRMDVSDLNSIKAGVQHVASVVEKKGLNLLINNAGILSKSTLCDCTPEDMQNVFNTNVIGPMNIIKEFLPLLHSAAKASKMSGMSCKKAAVVNISSGLGSMGLVKDTYGVFPAVSYRVSKAGLNMLALCAAAELKSNEILFSLLHPGWVRTDMGGEEGEIDASESVAGMLSVMATLTEKQSGDFFDYKGEVVPW
ncbi:C-factor-like [Xyrichtys novacula]|uniref:C-factor-like n=1 Tax=Xyrichtys novacula TaxID=13765 RepID=A0AAV1GNW9_XYRNO|nr:C-factor-like [Xyrichtys novacula]